MMSSAVSKISIIKEIPSGSIQANDTLSIDFNQYFDFSEVEDMSKLRFNVTQSSSKTSKVGDIYEGIEDHFDMYRFPPTTFKNASYTKYLDERSFVIVNESGEIIYEEITSDGRPKNFSTPLKFQVEFVGDNVTCQDVITWGEDKSLLVVGCVSRNPLGTDFKIFIQIINRATMTKHSDIVTKTIDNDSGFRIFNKLKLIEVPESET